MQHLKIRILIYTLILASGIFSGMAQASSISAPMSTASNERFCVFEQVGSPCEITAEFDALELHSLSEETLLFFERQGSRSSLVVSSRVEDAILRDEIDVQSGTLIEQEARSKSGARYELPATSDELKAALGFPAEVRVESRDMLEMLRVHVEIALTVSADTSRFLLKAMGVRDEFAPEKVKEIPIEKLSSETLEHSYVDEASVAPTEVPSDSEVEAYREDPPVSTSDPVVVETY